MDDQAQTHSRKLDHVRIVLDENVSAKGISTDFARWRLPHEALPDVDMAAIDLRTTFLGKSLNAPLLISSMTGGATDVTTINIALAEAAQQLGLAMGVGSQRAAIGDNTLVSSYQVRRVAPDIALYANLGAVQLNYGYGVYECQRAVDMIEADALILHLNALQEAVQPEGNTNFAGLLPKIAAVCRALSVPVIVKEVGAGISGAVAQRLLDAGVRCIDVAGAGGTSWAGIEIMRSDDRSAVDHLWDVGIPTAECLRECRSPCEAVGATMIASGGITTGTEAAVAIALGAHAVGTARPVLQTLMQTMKVDAAVHFLRHWERTLRQWMFLSGSLTIDHLRSARVRCLQH